MTYDLGIPRLARDQLGRAKALLTTKDSLYNRLRKSSFSSLIKVFIILCVLSAIMEIAIYATLVREPAQISRRLHTLYVVAPHIVDQLFGISFGLLSSALFFYFVFESGDKTFKQDLFAFTRESVLETANILHREFVPTGHFSISISQDLDFWKRSMEDYEKTKYFYYSGLDARIPLARMYAVNNEDLRRALFRIPLEDESLERAIVIKRKLIMIRIRREEAFIWNRDYHSGETSSTGSARSATGSPDLDPSYDKVREQIVKVTSEGLRYAYAVSAVNNAELMMRDWDETNNFRTEFMDRSIYLGNYHTSQEFSRFSPGVCQFPRSSFLHRIMRSGIYAQIDRSAADASTGGKKVLLFSRKPNPEQIQEFWRESPLYDGNTLDLNAETIVQSMKELIKNIDKDAQV